MDEKRPKARRPTLRTKKPCYELTLLDFATFPVWNFVGDETRYDETCVAPSPSIVDEYGIVGGLLAAVARFANGQEVPAYAEIVNTRSYGVRLSCLWMKDNWADIGSYTESWPLYPERKIDPSSLERARRGQDTLEREAGLAAHDMFPISWRLTDAETARQCREQLHANIEGKVEWREGVGFVDLCLQESVGQNNDSFDLRHQTAHISQRACSISLRGLDRVDIGLPELYAGLLDGTLKPVVDHRLQVYCIRLAGLAANLRPVFMFLPEQYSWVSSMLGDGAIDFRTQKWRMSLLDDARLVDDIRNKNFRPARINKKNAISGILFYFMDPYRNQGNFEFPSDLGHSSLFPSEAALCAYLGALKRRVVELGDFLVFPRSSERSPDLSIWDAMIRGSVRIDDNFTREGRAANRREYMRIATNFLEAVGPTDAEAYYQLHPNGLENFTPMSIQWGTYHAEKGLDEENEQLWEVAMLQLRMISHLGWPIFHPYIKSHMYSREMHLDSMEKWGRLSPSRRFSSSEAIGLMQQYVRKCEEKYPCLLDNSWDEVADLSQF